MPIHGFAWSLPWKTISRTSDTVTLHLQSSRTSWEFYPCDFELQITWSLSPRMLKADLAITHDEDGVGAAMGETVPATHLPTAPGFHPYFRMPLTQPGSTRRDWEHCEVTSNATRATLVTPAGNAGESRPYDGVSPHRLDDSYVHNLILGDLAAPTATLTDRMATLAIEMKTTGDSPLRYRTLWGKPAEGFFCMEPWCGLPDAAKRPASEGGALLVRRGETIRMGFSVGLGPSRS